MKIVCVGDNCVDHYIQTNEIHFGGNPINVSIYLNRNHIETAYIGYMGNDNFGINFYNTLKEKHIDVSHVQIKQGKTAVTQVEIINNDRVFGDYDEGVFKDFKLSSKDLLYIHNFDLMVSGIWSRVDDDLSNIHIPIAYDFADKWDFPQFKKCMPYISYAFYSDDVHSIEEIKQYMKKYYTSNLEVMICTRGSQGSIAYDGRHFYEYGIIECDIVDTMGAGDSYIAGFLISYLNNKNILEAMEMGAKESSYTLSYQGAW